MATRQTCADSLFRVGEMLQTASQYVGLCDEEKDGEDSLVIDLAANQNILLRHRCAQLSEDLRKLEKRLRSKKTPLQFDAPIK